MMDAGLNNGLSFNLEGRGSRNGRGEIIRRGRKGGRNGQGGRGGCGGRFIPAIICYNCNKSVHVSNIYPDLAETGETNFIINNENISFDRNRFSFFLPFSDLKSTWILLDN